MEGDVPIIMTAKINTYEDSLTWITDPWERYEEYKRRNKKRIDYKDIYDKRAELGQN